MSAEERRQRLSRLQEAVNKYVQKEQARITQEVSVLTGVRDGRRAGESGAPPAIEKAAVVAQTDLEWFLKGT